jgi:hypothetical protein
MASMLKSVFRHTSTYTRKRTLAVGDGKGGLIGEKAIGSSDSKLLPVGAWCDRGHQRPALRESDRSSTLGNDVSGRCPAGAIGALPGRGQQHVARSRRDVEGRVHHEGLGDRITAGGRRNRDANTLHLALTGMVIGDVRGGKHLRREGFQGDRVRAAIALTRAQGPDRGHRLGGRARSDCHGTRGDSACIASQPGIRHRAAGVMRGSVDEDAGGKERVVSTSARVVARPRAPRHACHCERDRSGGGGGRRWCCAIPRWHGSRRGCGGQISGGRGRISRTAGRWRTILRACAGIRGATAYQEQREKEAEHRHQQTHE